MHTQPLKSSRLCLIIIVGPNRLCSDPDLNFVRIRLQIGLTIFFTFLKIFGAMHVFFSYCWMIQNYGEFLMNEKRLKLLIQNRLDYCKFFIRLGSVAGGGSGFRGWNGLWSQIWICYIRSMVLILNFLTCFNLYFSCVCAGSPPWPPAPSASGMCSRGLLPRPSPRE